ncbi:hypothetical protein AB4Z48_10790 [Cupriavidus sp. 2TAF22]|uniref:hypothetical protein n=1 Tax=unclassified Cupriavidus TaxID=2640874 RepID=UPI003F9064E4
MPIVRKSTLVLGLALAVVLAGCVTRYRVETGTPASRVRLVTNTDDNTTFSVVDAGKCPKPPKPALLAATGLQATAMGKEADLGMWGISPEPAGRTRERWLVASHRIYLTAAATSAAGDEPYRCAIGVSFVPLPGWQYELRYQRNAQTRNCAAQVLRLLRAPSGEIVTTPDPTQQTFRGFEPDGVCASL